MTNRLRLPIPILVALVSSGLPVLGQQTLTSQSDEGAVCQTYDPTKIQVIAPSRDPFADSSWKIESAGALLEQAANQPDADRVATLALYYAEECRIVSTKPPVTYWKNPTRPLALPFPEDCRAYDPTAVSFYQGAVVDLKQMNDAIADQKDPKKLQVREPFRIGSFGDKEGAVVLKLAQQYTTACVIGAWAPPVTPDLARAAELDSSARLEIEEIQEAWHPVYYWKK